MSVVSIPIFYLPSFLKKKGKLDNRASSSRGHSDCLGVFRRGIYNNDIHKQEEKKKMDQDGLMVVVDLWLVGWLGEGR